MMENKSKAQSKNPEIPPARKEFYNLIKTGTLLEVQRYFRQHNLKVYECIEFKKDPEKKYDLDYKNGKIYSQNNNYEYKLAALGVTYGVVTISAGNYYGGNLGAILAPLVPLAIDVFANSQKALLAIKNFFMNQQEKTPVDTVQKSALGVAAKYGREEILEWLLGELVKEEYSISNPRETTYPQVQRLHGKKKAEQFNGNIKSFLSQTGKLAKRLRVPIDINKLFADIDTSGVHATVKREVDMAGGEKPIHDSYKRAFNPYSEEFEESGVQQPAAIASHSQNAESGQQGNTGFSLSGAYSKARSWLPSFGMRGSNAEVDSQPEIIAEPAVGSERRHRGVYYASPGRLF